MLILDVCVGDCSFACSAGEKYPAAIRGGSRVTSPEPEKSFRWGYFTRCLSDGIVHVRDDIGFRCVRTAP